MDYKIIWSPDALEDIEAIGEFIARDSEFYAESTIQKIIDSLSYSNLVATFIGCNSAFSLYRKYILISFPFNRDSFNRTRDKEFAANRV